MLVSQTDKFQPLWLQNVLEEKMKYTVNFTLFFFFSFFTQINFCSSHEFEKICTDLENKCIFIMIPEHVVALLSHGHSYKVMWFLYS